MLRFVRYGKFVVKFRKPRFGFSHGPRVEQIIPYGFLLVGKADLLRQISEPRRTDVYLSAVERLLAEQNAEQRRFPRAVHPDNARFVIVAYIEFGVVVYHFRTESKIEILSAHIRHDNIFSRRGQFFDGANYKKFVRGYLHTDSFML